MTIANADMNGAAAARLTATTRMPRKRNGRARFTRAARIAIWQRTGGHCFYCGAGLLHPEFEHGRAGDPAFMTVDHVLPNGAHLFGNLVPACRSCNAAKGAYDLRAWLEDWRTLIELRACGAPGFNKVQLQWLRERGYALTPGERHRFWFEQHGFRLTSQGAVPLYWPGAAP